mmetsp:Transcript_9549/g.25498  ORF Transcript_9549/g.25498 Transcript_9549/m.25498 type:complete len:708 (+) Transcript_9549:404-2527(+)
MSNVHERAYRSSNAFVQNVDVDTGNIQSLSDIANALRRSESIPSVISALNLLSADGTTVAGDAHQTVISHDARERFFLSGGCALMTHAMSVFIESEEVQVETLQALCSVLKASPHAQRELGECGGLHAMLDSMREWKESEAVLTATLGALRFAAFDELNRAVLIDLGLISSLADCLTMYTRNARVLGSAWSVLSNVSFRNQDTKSLIGEAGLIDLLLQSLDRSGDAGVDCDDAEFEAYVLEVLSGLRTLSFNNAACQNLVAQLNGVATVFHIVQRYEHNPKVIDCGLPTLSNIMADHATNVLSFAALGGPAWTIKQLEVASKSLPPDQPPDIASSVQSDGGSGSRNNFHSGSSADKNSADHGARGRQKDASQDSESRVDNGYDAAISSENIPWTLIEHSVLVLASAARTCLSYDTTIAAKMIEEGAIENATRLLRVPGGAAPAIVQKALVLLGALAGLVPGKERALQAALPESLVDVLQTYMKVSASSSDTYLPLLRAGLTALLALISGEDLAKTRALDRGAVDAVVKVSAKCRTDAVAVLKCCAVLDALLDGSRALNSREEKILINELTDIMSTHPGSARIQEHSCGILGKIGIWGGKDAYFADPKVIKMVEAARDRHKGNYSVESLANQFLTLVMSDSGTRQGRALTQGSGSSSRMRSRSRTVGSASARSRSRTATKSRSPPRTRTRRPNMAMPVIAEENEAAGD